MSNTKTVMGQASNQYVAPTFIEDVFSTYLYTGNDGVLDITNNIDLAGEGGMIWHKARTPYNGVSTGTHTLWSSETTGNLNSTSTDPLKNASLQPTFNSDGYTFPTSSWVSLNSSASNYVGWTFRKAPRFFDVVTYTGTGSARTVDHNLGQEVGCIIVKRTDTTADWQVYHRSLANTQFLVLNSTLPEATGANRWNSTAPTSSVFSVGTSPNVNASGGTYVAYLFAHDPLGPSGDGSDGLIACGSYTGNNSTAGPIIDLGYEPQWVMIKAAGTSGNWQIIDSMRGMSVGGADATLQANLSDAETSVEYVSPTATGFQVTSTSPDVNGSTITYIYIAIRRGPMRVPESGTEVFNTGGLVTGLVQNPGFVSGFVTDAAIRLYTGGGIDHLMSSRLQGSRYMETSNTTVEQTTSSIRWDYMNGWWDAINNNQFFSYMFRRAPNFFDVVAYTGTGAVSTFAHNLGVKPQMIWTKGRNDSTFGWYVYHEAVTAEDQLYLHLTNAAGGGFMNNTEPTDEVFTLGVTSGANASGEPFIAYLFATLAGVSKVGSYVGTGAAFNVDCGFTTGARFVLIKKTSNTGDWGVFDTARGITESSSPLLRLNSTLAEADFDYLDPYSGGFAHSGANATFNASGETYIFYAIA